MLQFEGHVSIILQEQEYSTRGDLEVLNLVS